MPIICDGIQSHKDTALGAIFSLSGYEIGDYGIEVWVKYFFGQLCPNGHWEDKSLKYFVIFTMLLFFWREEIIICLEGGAQPIALFAPSYLYQVPPPRYHVHVKYSSALFYSSRNNLRTFLAANETVFSGISGKDGYG